MFVIIFIGCVIFSYMKGIKKGMEMQFEKQKEELSLMAGLSSASDLEDSGVDSAN